jgi:hypothetical protein
MATWNRLALVPSGNPASAFGAPKFVVGTSITGVDGVVVAAFVPVAA